MKNKEKNEKYWHCIYCGKDQDASNIICENCGKDLVMNGEMITTGTRKVKDTKKSDTDDPGTFKKIIKKLFIAAGVVCGLVVVGFIGLLLIPDPDDVVTTTKPTTSPVQTTSPSQTNGKAVYPDFLDFANGFATIYEEDKDEGSIIYKMDVDDASGIMEEYVDLLLNDYPFSELYKGQKQYFHGFEYTGSADLTTFYITFNSSEEKFESMHFAVNNFSREGEEYIEIYYASELESESTTKRTTFKHDYSLPDFEDFANGYAVEYEESRNEYINKKVYRMTAEDPMFIMNEYVDFVLSSDLYNEIHQGASDYWKAFEHIDHDSIQKFTSSFSDKEYPGVNFSVSYHTSDGHKYITVSYVDDLSLVTTPLRTTYTEANVAPFSIPDFEIFADGLAPEIKSVSNSDNNLIDVYFELKDDEVLQDYIYLIEGYYSFEQMYDNKLYNWKGFKYKGNDAPNSFSITLQGSNGEQETYENNHLTAYLYDDSESGKRTLKLTYPDNFDVVEPLRKTSIS